jgi:predicted transcriptional regulator
LQAANGHNKITKTKILYATFLSYKQLQRYLALLIEGELLEYLDGTKSYRTTEKRVEVSKDIRTNGRTDDRKEFA